MDCRMFEKQVKSMLKEDKEARLDNGSWQHYQDCSKCRDRFAVILSDYMAEGAIPQSPGARASDPANEEGTDQLANPVEFKDAPITFTLYLNGREEAVKVVEPEMDVPLPEDARLVIKEKEAVWCDVRFAFNPDSDRPYELHFSVLMGISYSADHLVAFGTSLEQDKDLLNTYKMEIVDRGGVKAWIEMTQGKARLAIKYKGQIQ